MLQHKFLLKSSELGVLQCKAKGVETVSIDRNKHCRTKPKYQQPRRLKRKLFCNSCHFDLASDSKVTLILANPVSQNDI